MATNTEVARAAWAEVLDTDAHAWQITRADIETARHVLDLLACHDDRAVQAHDLVVELAMVAEGRR